MIVTDENIHEIIAEIGVRFPTFGGGVIGSSNNPISHALKDKLLQFAAGVNVAEVVRLVLSMARSSGLTNHRK